MYRIIVRATGEQAPYAIGEIVNDFAPPRGGLKKAWGRAHEYYNPMTIHYRSYLNGDDLSGLIDTYENQDGIDWDGVSKRIFGKKIN